MYNNCKLLISADFIHSADIELNKFYKDLFKVKENELPEIVLINKISEIVDSATFSIKDNNAREKFLREKLHEEYNYYFNINIYDSSNMPEEYRSCNDLMLLIVIKDPQL